MSLPWSLLPTSSGALPGCSAVHVAYVHVPKAGGDAVLETLAAANVSTCDAKSARGDVITGCDCLEPANATCAAEARAVMGEMSFEMVHDLIVPASWPPECTVWVAAVREPSSWFYSAAREWCRAWCPDSEQPCEDRIECSANDATLADLEAARWFEPARDGDPFRRALPPRAYNVTGMLANSSDTTAYWFRHANLQTRMIGGATSAAAPRLHRTHLLRPFCPPRERPALGRSDLEPSLPPSLRAGMFAQRNWMVCSTSWLDGLTAAMGRLLGAPLKLEARRALAPRRATPRHAAPLGPLAVAHAAPPAGRCLAAPPPLEHRPPALLLSFCIVCGRALHRGR